MIRRVILSGVLAVMAVLALALPAFALPLDPPTSLTIPSVKVFQDLAEDSDRLIVFHSRITYASYTGLADTPASMTFALRLFSPDGNTLLAESSPYSFTYFQTYGYKDGVSAFYFPAADNLTWGLAYKINMLGMPPYYDPAQTYTYTLTTADYSTATGQVDSRLEMYTHIISLCDDFHDYYPDYNLKTSTDTGVVLSVYGEAYFRAVVPGIQTMCPQLFIVQSYVPEKMPITPAYDLSLQETYKETLEGSDLMTGADRLGEYMGHISGMFVFGIITFLLCIGICIYTMRKGWGLEPGLLVSAGITICGSLLLGDVLFTIVMIGGLIAAMGIMWVLFMKRA
jgi:hypothetical protein